MRSLLYVAAGVAGIVGWWLGSYVNVWVALLASGVASVGGVLIAWRLLRDYF